MLSADVLDRCVAALYLVKASTWQHCRSLTSHHCDITSLLRPPTPSRPSTLSKRQRQKSLFAARSLRLWSFVSRLASCIRETYFDSVVWIDLWYYLYFISERLWVVTKSVGSWLWSGQGRCRIPRKRRRSLRPAVLSRWTARQPTCKYPLPATFLCWDQKFESNRYTHSRQVC